MTPELEVVLDSLLRTAGAALEVAIAELERLGRDPDARKLLERQIREWQQLQRAQAESVLHRAAGRLQ